jgi:hypothetical protein
MVDAGVLAKLSVFRMAFSWNADKTYEESGAYPRTGYCDVGTLSKR